MKTKEKHLRATPRKGTSYLRKVEKQNRSQYLSKCARTPFLSITVDRKQVRVNVGLGEGEERAYSDTDIDPKNKPLLKKVEDKKEVN